MKNYLISFLLIANFTTINIFSANAQNETIKTNGIILMDYPNSLEELLQQFKGKVVYIDVLASWCVPCIEEFKYSKANEAFFKENNIISLFISIDRPQDIPKSINLLNNNELTGHFISYLNPDSTASRTQFPKDVEKFFASFDEQGNITGMSIPQYVIIDKNGNVAELKANRPSDREELKKQLSSYL